MDTSKMNFTAILMTYIINKYEWTKQLGHYVYYKEHMKKPKKKSLKVIDEKCMCGLISKINNGFEIEDLVKDANKKYKSSKKIKNSDEKQDFVAYNVIEEKNEGSTIRLRPDYKFTGVNPYDDLKQPSNMSDDVFKEMIYLRSQFSKSKFSKFQYRFSKEFIIS
jgi:hypothetical protein